MNPAPHRINNLELEKFEMMDFFFTKVIYMNTKGGAG